MEVRAGHAAGGPLVSGPGGAVGLDGVIDTPSHNRTNCTEEDVKDLAEDFGFLLNGGKSTKRGHIPYRHVGSEDGWVLRKKKS